MPKMPKARLINGYAGQERPPLKRRTIPANVIAVGHEQRLVNMRPRNQLERALYWRWWKWHVVRKMAHIKRAQQKARMRFVLTSGPSAYCPRCQHDVPLIDDGETCAVCKLVL